MFLWIFGDNVEDALGHGRFLLFYLVCGVSATLLQAFLSPASTVPNLGASGAIAGVLGAYFVLYPRARVVTVIPLFILFPLVEIPAGLYLLGWFLLQFWMGSSQLASVGRGGAAARRRGVLGARRRFRRGRRVGPALPPEEAASGEIPHHVKTRGSTVTAWSLYELGATAFAMNLLSLHLPLDVAGRVPRGNEKFSLAFGLSMAVVALAAPFLGHLADRRGKRRFLVPFVLAGVAVDGPRRDARARRAGPRPLRARERGVPVRVRLLQRDAPGRVRRVERGARVGASASPRGTSDRSLRMFLVLPFVSGSIRAQMPHILLPVIDALSVAPVSSNVNDAWVRRNAYLPTALLWLAAAVPLLFFARLPKAVSSREAARAPEPNPSSPSKKSSSSSSPFSEVLGTIRSLPQTPALLWFLVSNFLYIDVIHTIQIQMATYSKFAVGLTDGQVQVLLLVATAVAVVGGLLYGWLCQRVTIRTATLVALFNWVLVFALALLVRDPKAFTVVGVLAGIGLGGIKVTGRLGLIALVPKERMTEFFGFFTLAGEAASVLGPVVWAGTLALFPDRSPAGYRAGVGVLFAVLALAIGSFLKVTFPRDAQAP